MKKVLISFTTSESMNFIYYFYCKVLRQHTLFWLGFKVNIICNIQRSPILWMFHNGSYLSGYPNSLKSGMNFSNQLILQKLYKSPLRNIVSQYLYDLSLKRGLAISLIVSFCLIILLCIILTG